MNTDLMFSSKTDLWSTPQDFYDKLNDEFNFDLDPCSTHENAKCEKHFTIEDNGLSQDWGGCKVFCNPPYGRVLKDWVKKMLSRRAKGKHNRCNVNTGENRYKLFPRLYIWKIRNKVFKGSFKIWTS